MALSEKQRTPPVSAKNNAKKALRWRKEYPDQTSSAGTPVGWARARQLAKGGPLSEDVIKRMAQFNRHRSNAKVDPKFKDEPWRDKGYLMWLAWGGTSGVDWAISRSEMMDNDKNLQEDNMGKEIKHLTVGFEMKQMIEDDDYYMFEGYASTFGNVDFGMDRVMRGAFKECIGDYTRSGKMPPVLWQHDMAMPLGMYTEMREDDRGLFVKGRMPKADDMVRGRVMPQMKAGSISKMSIGYITKRYDMDGEVRNLMEVDLMEISLVTMPMNPEAAITGMKSLSSDDIPDMTERELANVLRNGVKMSRKTSDKMISCLKKGGLWDAENSNQWDADEDSLDVKKLDEILEKLGDQ